MRWLAGLAAVLIVGCAPTDAEMRARPALQFTSSKSADDLVTCLVPSLSENFRWVVGGPSMFTATVRSPGHEYDIVTPDALLLGKYTFTVNVRGSVVSVYEGTGRMTDAMRARVAKGIPPCL